MRHFSDEKSEPSWKSLGITEDFWLANVVAKLMDDGMAPVVAAHAVIDHESAALSGYHNGLAITLSVRRIQELVK